MNFLSFSKIFAIESKPLTFFMFIFDKKIMGNFYEYEKWKDDYDNISHGIRGLVAGNPKLYAKHLSRLTKILLNRDIFVALCHNIHDNIQVDENTLKIFNDEQLEIIKSEINEKSPFMVTLQLMHDNSDKLYATDIFLLFCMLYSIYSKFYNVLFPLYDITNINTYDKIYSDILSAHDILNYRVYYTSKKNSNILGAESDISEYHFFENYWNNNYSEITISDLTGSAFIVDKLLKNKIIKLLESGKHITLVITNPEVSLPITRKMYNNKNEFLPYKILEHWQFISSKYKNKVNISLVNIPLMHEIICFDKNIIYTYFYTYFYKNDLKFIFDKSNPHFKLYLSELNQLKFLNDTEKPNEEHIMQYIGDENNIAFFKNMLLDKENCKEIWVLSLFACYCALGEIAEIINQRLKEGNLKLKFILMHPDMEKVTFQWYENFQTSLFMNFNVFSYWAEIYPENFQLRFTHLPITNRLYINISKEEMRVEHFAIPLSTNQNLAIHLKKSDAYNKPLFDNYISQFNKLWNDYSTS